MACLSLATKDTNCFIRVQGAERRVENIGLQGEKIRYTTPIYCARFVLCSVFNVDASDESLVSRQSAEHRDGRLPITDEDSPPNIASFSSFKPGITVFGKIGWHALIVQSHPVAHAGTESDRSVACFDQARPVLIACQ